MASSRSSLSRSRRSAGTPVSGTGSRNQHAEVGHRGLTEALSSSGPLGEAGTAHAARRPRPAADFRYRSASLRSRKAQPAEPASDQPRRKLFYEHPTRSKSPPASRQSAPAARPSTRTSGRMHARALPGPPHWTDGCIRTTDDAIQAISDRIEHDPLTTIEIRNNDPVVAVQGKLVHDGVHHAAPN